MQISWLLLDRLRVDDAEPIGEAHFCGVPSLGVKDQPALQAAVGREAILLTPVEVATKFCSPIDLELEVDLDGEQVGPSTSLYVAIPHGVPQAETGYVIAIDDLHGFSGSGVFFAESSGVWSPDNFKLAGIFVAVLCPSGEPA